MNFYPNSLDGIEQASVTGGKVGILMRTKDRPILLARALSSVLSQRYSNWTLYVINDAGDVDQLNALLAPFHSAFNGRLTVINRKQSSGMEAASNAGLSKALDDQCDYICVHDDDDAWDASYLAETVSWLEHKDHQAFAAVITEMVIVGERINGDCVNEEGWEQGFVPPKITFANMAEANQFAPICMTLRASVATAIGAFNEALPVLGDWDYNLRILLEGDIGVIPKKLAYYHHRKTAEAAGLAAYGNSVTTGSARHDHFGTLFLNSITRQMLRDNPGWFGILHILMKRAADSNYEMRAKFEYIERALVELRPVMQEVVKNQRLLMEQMKEFQKK